MKSTRRHILYHLLWILTVLNHSTASAQTADVAVPRWEPRDFTFDCKANPSDPFKVALTADLLGPDGTKLNLPGFYDGGHTWKIRAAASAPGQWSLTTHSDLPELNGQQRQFTCIANPSHIIHGGLRIDAEHHHQFIWEDGTHYLPVGYECDWLWALDSNDPELKILNPFLDKLTSTGFNLIILNAYAYDTTWRKGKTADDDFGPPPLLAWEGTNQTPDYSRFNLAYWQHYDRVIDAMYRRGIVAHMLMKVHNKQVNWPANASPEDDLYYRWLIARYAAYPNINWDLAKEAHYEKDVNYKINRLKFIRNNDAYHRLLTVHDDRATYNRGTYDSLLDYRSDQQHTNWHQSMLDHLSGHTWPVINTEFGYEHGPGGLADKTYGEAQSPETVCTRAWEVYTSGGFGVYYYTYTAWDILRPLDTPPGYGYFKNLHDFFNSTNYWLLTPNSDISSDGFCLANPGVEYVIFLKTAAPLTLNLPALSTPVKAEWFQPFSGEKKSACNAAAGSSKVQPPAEWTDKPVVLHLYAPRQP